MFYSDGKTVPKVGDIVKGVAYTSPKTVVGIVVGLATDQVDVKVCIQKQVDYPMPAGALNKAAVYCETPSDATCPTIALEQSVVVGPAKNFQPIPA